MRVYILDEDGNVVGLPSDTFNTLTWARRYWAADTFSMETNVKRLWASEIALGRILYLPDEGNLAFLIEQIETIDEPGLQKDIRRVSGRGIEGFIGSERLVDPRPDAYDIQNDVPAETAMKHYVDSHAGPSADTERQIPRLVIATDDSRGENVTVKARFQTVGDLLREIGLFAGLGWGVTFNPDTKDLVFDIIEGMDRSDSVFFDIAFDTISAYSELASLVDSKTFAVVAGQGELEDREIVDRFLGSEPSGFARRELFQDARDVEVGDTTILEQRGDAVLESLGGDLRFEADVHQFGSFQYGTHWGVGDLVLLRDQDRGLSKTVRVVSVSSTYDKSLNVPERSVELDRPWPTMQERIEGGFSGGAVETGGALTLDHDDLLNVTADQHHARSHDHSNASDGTALVPVSLSASDGSVTSTRTLSGADRDLFAGKVSGEGNNRVRIRALNAGGGSLEFGDGSAAPDTILFRQAAGVLQTDDALRALRFTCTLTQDAFDGNAAGTSYPVGLSFMSIASTTNTGWPYTGAAQRGTVVTWSNGGTLIHQLWFQRGASSGTGTSSATRNWNNGGSSWNAWQNIST